MLETSAMEFGFITSATLSASDDNVANGCVSFVDKMSCTLTGDRCNQNVRKAASLIFSPASVFIFLNNWDGVHSPSSISVRSRLNCLASESVKRSMRCSRNSVYFPAAGGLSMTSETSSRMSKSKAAITA